MKYIDKHSLLINDHIVLYKADGSNDVHRSHDTVLMIHYDKVKISGVKYNLHLAHKPLGDKIIYYRYGVQDSIDTDALPIEEDLDKLIDEELEKLKLDLLFDKARSER